MRYPFTRLAIRLVVALSLFSGDLNAQSIGRSNPKQPNDLSVSTVNGYRVARGQRPPIDLNELPTDAFESGRLRIKISPNANENIQENIAVAKSGYARTGISAIDRLNDEFKVTRYKPVLEEIETATKSLSNQRNRHRAWGFHLWYELEIDSKSDVLKAVKQFAALNEVEHAEPVYAKRRIGNVESLHTQSSPEIGTTWLPDDPRFDEQWHYHNTGQSNGTAGKDINLVEAWETEMGHPDVVVAIIDGGIQINHPDLLDNIWPGIGYNFVNDSPNVTPDNHGTHVAGTIAAVNSNSIGVSGIAGGSNTGDGIRLMSCQVFAGWSGGGFEIAPIYAADNGAAISQNSWGYINPNVYEQIVLDAIDYFNANGGGDVLNGGITIFASGNDNSSAAYYPGYYPGALSVSATNNRDEKAWYSNYGLWVDISAPGGETSPSNAGGVLSALTGSSYGFYQGTSMACPHVSGVAALLVSYAHRNGFKIDNTELWNLLVENTDDHYSDNPNYTGQLGSGRLNANNSLIALDEILNGVRRPSSLSAASVSTTQINISWAKNDEENDVVLVWSPDGTFGSPKDSVLYVVGDTIEGRGKVIYRGSSTEFTHLNLNPSTKYFYRAFSFNSDNEYSSGRNTNAYTLCNALTIPYSESFESGENPPLCWSAVDSDGDGRGWVIGGASYSPPDGNFVAVSASKDYILGDLTPDNWLISPQFSINSNYVLLRFFVKSQNSNGANEKYSILVSNEGLDLEDFSEIYTETLVNANWKQVIVPINGYQGQNIYIAFRHWDCTGQSQLVIDNISFEEYQARYLTLDVNPSEAGVTTGDGGFYNGELVTVSATRNPGYIFVNWTLDEEEVSKQSTYSFPMPTRDVTLVANFTDKIPEISVDPTLFEEDLFTGDIETRTITVYNNGDEGSTLNISLGIYENGTTQGLVLDPKLIESTASSTESISSSLGSPSNYPVNPPKISPKAAGLSVLYANTVLNDGLLFRNALENLGNVEEFHELNLRVATPNVDYLLEYDVVIIASNHYFANPELLGDNLADYVDAGGSVCILQAAYSSGGKWALDGRIITPDYSPLSVTSYSLGTISCSEFQIHNLTHSVDSLSTDIWSYSTVQGSGVSLGNYSTSFSAVAYNPDKPIISINVFPGDGMWGGDLIQLMQNALDWLGSKWLIVEEEEVTIAAGDSHSFNITFDATGLNEGVYESMLRIESNDPENPVVDVPITMNVTGASVISLSHSSIEFGDVPMGVVNEFPLSITSSGTASLLITNILSSNPYFEVSATELEVGIKEKGELVITFLSLDQDIYEGTLTFETNAPANPSFSIDLSAQALPPAVIAVDPASIHETVGYSKSLERVLTITNNGGMPLGFSSSISFDTDIDPGSKFTGSIDLGTSTLESENTSDGQPITRSEYIRYNKGASGGSNYNILIYENGPTFFWYRSALDELGLDYTVASTWNALATALDGSTQWDLVLVNSYHGSSTATAIDALANHLNSDGKLIFAHWKSTDFSGHSLSQIMGINVISSYTIPINFSLTPNASVLSSPNTLPDEFFWKDNQYNVDGHIVETMANAERLAVFDGNPNSAAIVLNAEKNSIFNAFQSDNYSGDDSGSGKADIQELLENQIMYLLQKNLSVTPSWGFVPMGESIDLTVTLSSEGLAEGIYNGEITILSNDPINTEIIVPITMDVEYERYTLTVEMNPEDGGVATGEGEYHEDEIVPFKATPNEGFMFVSWTLNEEVVTKVDSFVFTMPGHEVTLAANFTDKIPAISVEPDSIGEHLYSGNSVSRTITISNNGDIGSNLILDIAYHYENSQTKSNADISLPSHKDLNNEDSNRPIERASYSGSYEIPTNKDYIKRNSASYIFFDDFESGLGEWYTEAYSSADLWHISNLSYSSPSYAIWCGIKGSNNYDNGQRINNAIISPAIYLPSHSESIELSFWENYITESGWDKCSVDISTNNGGSWVNIRSGVSGSSGDWVLRVIDISNYAGQTIRVRFHFDTQDRISNNYPGWFIDDVGVSVDNGWVSFDPQQVSLAAGELFDLTIDFDADDMLEGLYETIVRITSNDPVKPVVDVPVTLEVEYERFALTVESNPAEGGFAAGEGSYLEDETVLLEATPNEGYMFINWTINEVVISQTQSFEFSLPANDVTIVANFTDQIPEITVEPDTLNENILCGRTLNRPLTISNTALGELIYSIEILPAHIEVGNTASTKPRVQARPIPKKGVPLPDIYSERPLTSGGGPDEFGYSWSIVPIDWIDASSGTSVSLGDDSWVGSIPLGFEFDYYGQTYSQINIMSNGWVSFTSYNSWYPDCVPGSGYGGAIVPLGKDLNPATGGSIYYLTQGAAPNRKFIVEFNNIRLYGSSVSQTFQVVLHERSGRILFQYLVAPTTPGSIGIESPDGDIGIGNCANNDLFINPNIITSNLAIEFIAYNTDWLSLSSYSGSVFSGEDDEIDVLFDATSMNEGTYNAILRITSNDPESPVVDIPVTLNVIGTPNITISNQSLDFGSIQSSAVSTLPIIITNTGSALLEISDIEIDDNEFYVNTTEIGINPGASYNLMVSFYSDSPGVFSSNLTFSTNVEGNDSYTIPLSAEVSACTAPFNLTASWVNSSQAVVTWNYNTSADEWELIYGYIGFNPETEGTLEGGISNSSFFINGLESGVSYQVFVRSICGAETSNWSDPAIISSNNSMEIYRTPIPIVLDGELDAIWNLIPPAPIEFDIDANIYGSATIDAHWKACWDDNGIYVVVVVEDDNHFPGWMEGAFDHWSYDKPELYFDLTEFPVTGEGGGFGCNGIDDGRIQIAPTFQEYFYGYELSDSWQVNHSYSHQLYGDDYIFEYFIPFSSLEDYAHFDPNRLIGFDVTVIDRDMGDTWRRRKTWSNDNSINDSWNNMDGCGTISLSQAVLGSGQIVILNLTANPSAGGTTSGSGSYNEGHEVVVSATASNGYNFVNWTRGVEVVSNQASFSYTMPGHHLTLTAQFAINSYTLSYSAGIGGTIVGDSLQSVTHGANGTIITATPATGYEFIGWSDGKMNPTRTDSIVSGDINVTANFQVIVLSLNYLAGSDGSITGDTLQFIDYGQSGTAVNATANYGYHFSHWTDSITSNPRTDQEVIASISVEAIFEINSYFLVYLASAGGTINPEHSSQKVIHGSNGIAVTAIPNEGYVFVEWSDGRTDNPRVDSAIVNHKSVTAYFEALLINQHTLTVEVVGNGSVSINGTAYTEPVTVNDGTILGISAITDTNWQFDGWTGQVAQPNQASTIVTMNSNISITATFSSINSTGGLMLSDVGVYPNPFSNSITLTSMQGVSRVVITSLLGSSIMDMNLEHQEQITINTEKIARGMYLINLYSPNGERTVIRVIKQ